MKVEVYCKQCPNLSPDGELIESYEEMRPEGPLYINDYKDQTQEYKCPNCNISISITINTLK